MLRCATVVAWVAGAVCSTVALAAETVTIDLTGLQIRNNTPQTRSSAPNTIDPAFQYLVEISENTSVRGVGGILGTLYPNPTPLSQVLTDLGQDPGTLGGIVDNPRGRTRSR